MFLRRIFKGIPDVGPWLSIVELLAGVATLLGTLVALNVIPNPFVRPPTSGISGMVIDTKTSKPLPEASVQILDSATKMIITESVPDAKGEWKELIKPGAYTIKATADGYRPVSKSVSVVQDKFRVVRLDMARPTEAEVKAASQAGQPQTKVVAVPVMVPQPVAAVQTGAAAATAPSQPVAPKANPVQKALDDAKALCDAGHLDQARNLLEDAVGRYPSEGLLYANIIIYDAELFDKKGDKAAKANAVGWIDEGKRKAKKNLKEFRRAAQEWVVE